MRLFEGTEFDIPPKCERCGLLEEVCQCLPEPEKKELLAPERQKAIVSVEKRKKGKMVTLVSGLDANVNDFPTMLTGLKNRCGAGGTIKGDSIEIQGKHVQPVVDALVQMGYKVKTRG